MATEGGGWTVIDHARDAGWPACFTQWNAGAEIAGAATSCLTWREWFGPATPTTQFRLSPECGDVSGSGMDEVYRWTGNQYGCNWYNRNCDYTGTCSVCVDNFGGTRPGTCPLLLEQISGMGSGADYEYCFDCATDWWNTAPSIGIDGTGCIAYR
jgi:hypothetical protein